MNYEEGWVKMKILTIIVGVILVIGGFFSIATPLNTFTTLGWVIGILLLIAGINIIVDYFMLRKAKSLGMGDLLVGVLTVALALFVLYGQIARVALDAILIVLFGAWVLIGGIMRIVASLNHKKNGDSFWIWIMLFGILSVIVGVYGFFNPVVFAFAIGWMIGFLIIMQGINLIGLGFTIKKADK